MSELPNLPFAVFDEFGQSCEDRVADHYRAAAQAAQPEAVGEWKRVPVKPTSNMLAAMSGEWHPSRHETARKQYAAMLYAAPTSCDLRCISSPTGGDDYDIRWIVIEHHMAAPHEREIGESYTDEPRDAIRAAISAKKV